MSLEDFSIDNFTTATDAFKSLIKTLCLDEYPCKNVKQNNKTIKFNNGKKFLIKDDDEYINRKEDLLDLIRDKNSPWYINYDWSNEANKIRELYISEINSININNIEQYFKTLRFVDKNIKEIDNGLLKFNNLNELVLNVNWIENCDSKNLPSTLKLLDLGGNQISSLESLVRQPLINLEHLGLSFNHLYDLKDYLTPNYWPSLVSLDLSNNHLTNLKDLIINKLKKLDKLKNLTLYGNPICLIPSYRGFIVDTLISLNYLDDQAISKDERFRYFNMRLYADSIRNEADITITVTNLKNIYMPYELKYPETQPEFPVTIFKYLVNFKYVEDKEHEDLNKTLTTIKSASSSKSKINKSVLSFNDINQANYRETLKDRFTENKPFYDKIIRTQQMDYNENIQFNDKGVLKIKHKFLRPLRDFMMHGLEINVIEQKLTYDEKSENDVTLTPSPSKKGVKIPSANKNKKEAAKDNKKDAKKGGDKRKKDINAFLADLDLKKTEETILGEFKISLDSILDTNRYKIEQTFNNELKIPEYVINEFEGNLDSSVKGDKKDKKGGKQQPPAKPDQNKGKKKDTGKGASTSTVEESASLKAKILELNLKFDVLQFQNFEEFRTYLNTTQNISQISKITKNEE